MKKTFLILVILAFSLMGCVSDSSNNQKFPVTILDGNQTFTVDSTFGTTVDQLLRDQQITIGALDRVSPPLNTFLQEGDVITITRVSEEFSIVESVLPFEQQTIKNESLPEGQTVLIQSGLNGRQQTTYRIVFENGKEVSRILFKEEVVQEPKPEIIMIGVQSPFTAVPIDGVIAYISSGNAWIMETNTGNRKIVASAGDLDGRIFTLSFDRKWLLFSRSSSDADNEMINSLWLVDLTKENPKLVDTGIRNVVHYADWVPGKSRTISYSSVEPRTTAPGWQANNDLHLFTFDDEGKKVDDTILVDANSGGIYGWWGTIFQWSQDGSQLAYARPDSIGTVDTKKGTLFNLIDFESYQPKTDWAWIPGISWSQDNLVLYTILNEKDFGSSTNDSYSLSAILMDTKKILPILPKCGLFCYSTLSPLDENGNFQIAYLSAILPEQSETSRYNLSIMDRDGSNRKKVYPGEGQQGLDPQSVYWSPASSDTIWLAFIAQGNLMLAEPSSGVVRQITGDGSISKINWR